MTTYVIRNGILVEKDRAGPPPSSNRPQRHISDTMDMTWHPASGKRFDSKARFRAETKAHGCIEVGNSMPARPQRKWRMPDKEARVRDIQRAIHDLRSR